MLVDEKTFPLNEWLLRPHPGTLTEEQNLFNYHLSKARGTIENSFGILTTRWRIKDQSKPRLKMMRAMFKLW